MRLIIRGRMFAPLAIAYHFYFQLIYGPMFVIFLASCLILRLKFPLYKAEIGWALIVAGFFEAIMSLTVIFLWGLPISIATIITGVTLVRSRKHDSGKEIATAKPKLKKGLYIVLMLVIIVSALVFSLRVTNVVHEQFLVNYHGGNASNLTLKGSIIDIKLNYEVNTGYSYHIFPAVVTLDVTDFVWGSGIYDQTSSAQYWEDRNVVIYYEKTSMPKLTIGQQIEVKGYYTAWMEDSLYSNRLVISSTISESYIQAQ